jgi:hypothetical protein
LGISINRQVPTYEYRSGTYLNTDRNNNNIVISGNIELNVGDRLNLVVSRITASAGTIIVRHATLLLNR